jgi:hypothetical protein
MNADVFEIIRLVKQISKENNLTLTLSFPGEGTVKLHFVAFKRDPAG